MLASLHAGLGPSLFECDEALRRHRRPDPGQPPTKWQNRPSSSRPSTTLGLAAHGEIFHTHAKDMALLPAARVNGVLDTVPLDEPARRSWIFRTVGWGHSELEWRGILTAVRRAGYDDVLSIEHEDLLLSVDDGFRKAVTFLRAVMPTEPPLSSAWWA